MEAWQWWGAKNPEEWPELLESLVKDARKLLKDFFGHDAFRPEQEKVLRSALNRQDSEIYWPTAAGKSLIYQLFALLSWQRKRGIVLVVEPTIPVLQDQVQKFNARAEEFHRTHGDDEDAPFQACLLGSAQKDEKIIDQAVRGQCCLVYLCPESLTQKYLEAFFHLRDRERVSMIAVDEACYIPLWGQSFRPAFQDLSWLREAYEAVPILALSGTAPPKRQNFIRHSLKLQNPLRSTRPMFRPNLQLQMHRCETEECKLQKVLELLEHGAYPAVVYVPTKPDARRVRRRLTESLEERRLTLTIGYMDGETPPASRASINLDFQSKEIDLMVATDAYGQGIDKADIRLIVHWEPPVNFEMYVNHIGRAGRDGFEARCVLLYSNSCWAQLFESGRCFTRELEEMDEEDRQVEFASRSTLKDMVTSKKSCRWRRLLRYYECEDELPLEGCGSCDICLGQYDRGSGEGEDFSVGARLLLSSLRLKELSKVAARMDVLDLALGKCDLEPEQQELLQTMETLRSSLPAKQRQKGWLQELWTLLWNNDFVIKKYAGIHDVKLKRKKWQRKDILKFLWFLTNKGQKALEDDKAIQLIPSKRMTAMATGVFKHIKAERQLSDAYQEFKRLDRADNQARAEALDNMMKVLNSAKTAHSKKQQLKEVKPLKPKVSKSRSRRRASSSMPAMTAMRDLTHVALDDALEEHPETNEWKMSYRENPEEGTCHCTLTVSPELDVVEAIGRTRAESLKMAIGRCSKQHFRIDLREKKWIQQKFAELPCAPRDVYFEIVGVGHRRNGTVLWQVATLSFPNREMCFRGNPCEHWALAVRSGVAAAKKGLAAESRGFSN